MRSKKFALIGGSLMMILGLFALIPTLSVYSETLPALNLEASYGYFLGIFPMNIVSKTVLILFGIAGISASNANTMGVTDHNISLKENISINDSKPSIIWARVVLFAMGALALLGIFDQTATFGGYYPLFGSMVWLNALFAVFGGYFGYAARTEKSGGRHNILRRV